MHWYEKKLTSGVRQYFFESNVLRLSITRHERGYQGKRKNKRHKHTHAHSHISLSLAKQHRVLLIFCCFFSFSFILFLLLPFWLRLYLYSNAFVIPTWICGLFFNFIPTKTIWRVDSLAKCLPHLHLQKESERVIEEKKIT